MAVCENEEELLQAFAKTKHLSGSHFGDSSVFLERYVSLGRHIEVQIFGDGRGRAVSLGERDCSLQRRKQKVIEETPAPGLTDATRAAMEAAAVRLVSSGHYRSAGTVEFLYDVRRAAFSFLEVNTRLQVEHGVTELVTGLDLVEWMVRLAAGEDVLPAQPVPRRGAAMQVAAMRPQFLTRDEVPADVVENERRIAEATAKEEGKPEAAMPKIVEGRVNAFFKDNCLLEQPSVVDSKKNVAQVLAESGTTVTGFARFEPGQA